VCVDFRDVNNASPKHNYPTPFINQIIDDYARCEIFSFMDGFPAIIRSISAQKTNIKLVLFVPGAHSHMGNSLLV